MKTVLLGVIITLLGIIAYLNWLAPIKIPDGKVLLHKSYIDSLYEVAQLPPDTIVTHDTTWMQKTVYVQGTTPLPKDSTEYAYTYEDSLKTSELLVYVKDSISRRGLILNRKWSYRLFVPMQITREITITKPIPMPFETIKENKAYYRYYGQVGYNFMNGGLVGELGIVKGRFMVGAEGGRNLGAVKIGILF